MRAYWLILAGCAGAPDADPLRDPDPLPVPIPLDDSGDAWLRTGQVGDLTLIREAPSHGAPHQVRVAALFADHLQGLPFAAACDRLGELCLPADAPHEQDVDTRSVALDPDASRFSWVGDRLGVGPALVRFEVFEQHPTAGYAARFVPEQPLPDRLDLSFEGGEWGDLTRAGGLPVPRPFEVLEPDPNAPVLLAGAPFQRIRWTPVGHGSMVLTQRSAAGSSARWLDDDGEALIDASAWRSSEPVRVDLWHVAPAETMDVGGNSLVITPISGQGWCLVDTCDPPFAEFPTSLPFQFCWTTTNCGDARWFLASDGTWSTSDGYLGTWEWDCCTRQLSLIFSSGTVYRGRLDDDGCIEGQMLSWSGNQGVWRGCL